ncbi:MAG TPA: hypothetical protein DCS82_07920, partial [Rhodospirillaceae bacterium]|nr:hypothetical protein [Rhodospirillaceae bacterium]
LPISTVTNADLIYVLNEGKVVEQGTHASLLAQDGLYAHLCRIQFEDSAALGGDETAKNEPVEA